MVFIECNADEELLRRGLGVPKRVIAHACCKSRVAYRVRRGKGQVGLVDEDPYSNQPPYFQDTAIIEEDRTNGLVVRCDAKRNNHFVVLCPKLEDWVLEAAREAGIDLDAFSLPSDPDRLHAVVNTHLKRFKELLDALKKRNTGRLARLYEIMEGLNVVKVRR